tara:strand:- start:5660 stop:13231 length:7572 start_codon:yes stop_codon:yes gene_type:complete
MKEYLKNKLKKINNSFIHGKSSDKGDEERKRYYALRANADQLQNRFTRLMPPLANDLLLSSAELTNCDLISEGPLEGFVNSEGKSCTPLEATFLDGTVVAEPNIENVTTENLIFDVDDVAQETNRKFRGVRYDFKGFVSGRLNNYVQELNRRFLHKEPITRSKWIEGLSDINGLFGSRRTYRGARIEPLQDINNILNCTPSSVKNTVMIWGAGKKYNANGELQDAGQMDLAPNEMIRRYIGAGFKKSPYAYRKIYHPDNVTKRNDYLAPQQGQYTFSESHPVLYQGSFDFGCAITGNGYLHRSFCSRGFFKYVANPENVGTNGNYENHQSWIKEALGEGGANNPYKSKFTTNGRPGKYVHSLAAQSEPEGLKEPIIDAVARKINTLGIDYFKPIRFHESYTGRYVNGETARDDRVVGFRVTIDRMLVTGPDNYNKLSVDDYNADFEPNGTANGSTAWKDFTNNHTLTKTQRAQGDYVWLYIDDDAIPQFTSPVINGATATSAEYPWNVNGELKVDQIDDWASFMDYAADTDGDGENDSTGPDGRIDYRGQETLRFSNFETENGNEHWSYTRHNGGGNNGIGRTAFASKQIDGVTDVETGVCTYNSWYSKRILIEKATIGGKLCEKFKIANEEDDQEDPNAIPTLEQAEVEVNWEIVSTDTISTNDQGTETKTRSWRVGSVDFIKRGKNYRGTPTLSFNGLEAYNTPANASNSTAGSLPDITGSIGQGGRVETLQIDDRGRVKGVGTDNVIAGGFQAAVVSLTFTRSLGTTFVFGEGSVYSWSLTGVQISPGSNYRGTPTVEIIGLAAFPIGGSLPTITVRLNEANGVELVSFTAGKVRGTGARRSGGLANQVYEIGVNRPYVVVNVLDVGAPPISNATIEGASAPDTKVGYSVSVIDANPPASTFVPDETSAFLVEATLPGASGNPQRWYKPNQDYKITGQIYIPSSNSKVDSFRFNLAGDSTQGISSQGIPGGTISGGSTNYPKNQWRPFDIEFTNSGNNNFRKMLFEFLDGTSNSNLTTEGDFVAIKDFTVFEKTNANEESPKDYRMAYMAFNAEKFFGSDTFENNKEINFAVDDSRLDVGDTNGLNFVFSEVNGFNLVTRQVRENIVKRDVTADEVCNSRNSREMKYPFVTGATNFHEIGYELTESKSNKFKGAFLWPVYLGDQLKPLNTSNKLVNTGKLFITTNDSSTVSGNKLQSGIDHDYDVFKILNDNTIKYAHIANPNLGAPSANIIDKKIQIQVKEKAPGLFNFTNFSLNYNLGEEKQIPLSDQSTTAIDYNKALFGPNEVLRAGNRMTKGNIATAEATLSRFLHRETSYGAKYYRWRVDSVNITDGGSNYSNNVALNFISRQGGLQVYEQPTATVTVTNGVVQSATFNAVDTDGDGTDDITATEARGQFEGSGFTRGTYMAHEYDGEQPVVEVQVVDLGTNSNPGDDRISADLSLNFTVDKADFNYGMRNYNAIDGTASSDVESDGTYQSDWMENVPLDSDHVPVIHTVTRKEVDCIKVTFVIEELFQEIFQEQDPLGASVKKDALSINFSIFCSFDGVPENIYKPQETKVTYYGTVTSFYAVDTNEITLPSYSELLNNFPSDDVNSLAAKFPRKVEIRKNDFETTSIRMGRSARVYQVKEVIKEKFSYPFSSVIKTTVDARTFSQVPNRQWRMRLKKIKVPSNYYPLDLEGKDKRFIKNAADLGTRVIYDGDWDGTFKIAWTDNPAWILYDLMINQRYGIGNRIDNLEDINIFNLYKIGRYCDAVDSNGNFVGLDDGLGGLEPRFSCNTILQASQNAFKTIADICTVFNGMAFYANGRLDFFADQPKEPMMFFNNDNVFDGIFSYQTTNKSSQFNVAEVTFLDKDDDFTAKKETIMDEVSMRENGILRRDINAKGATSRGQAARLGRYILYTNKLEREIVNFKAGSDGLMLSIGDIIEIQDELKNFETSFGKVLNLNTDGDKFLEIESGPDVDSILTNHTGAFVMAPTGQDKLTDMYDNLLEGEPVDNDVLSGLYTTQAQKLKVTGVKQLDNKIKIGVEDTNGYLDLVQTGSFVNLDMQNRNVRQYRILKITPEESNLYAISATEYRKEKFDLIEAPVDFKIDEEDSFNIGIPKNTINTVTEPVGFEAVVHYENQSNNSKLLYPYTNTITDYSLAAHTLEQTIQFTITGDLTGNESAYQLTVIRPNGKIESKIIPKGNVVNTAQGNFFVTSGDILGGSTGLDLSFGTYNFEVTSKSSEEIFGDAPVSTFGNISNLYDPDYVGFSSTDSDTDRLTDFQENIIYTTNPFDFDTDDDNAVQALAGDGDEVFGNESIEDAPRTDPLDPDTDDGRLPDGFELEVGADPLDPSDDATAANPFITGFRLKNAPRVSIQVGTTTVQGTHGGTFPVMELGPNLNGLYELAGEIRGKPYFKGARNYPTVNGDEANYISIRNPYKHLYDPGFGIIKYGISGHWRIETNRNPNSAPADSKIQLITGGAGKDYPWQVTDWKSLSTVSTHLPYSAYANRNVNFDQQPEFIFKFLENGTVIPDELGG